MIVTNVEQGWEVVFQPAHGLLAGTLANKLAPEYHTPFWFETITAIAAHDDNKIHFSSGERHYVTDVGAPKDFTLVSMTAQERFLEVNERLENAYRKHQWFGLLNSMHAEVLYANQNVSKSLQQLLEDEQKHRTAIMRHLKVTKADVQNAYDVFRWCDRCSLILCQNQLPAMQRRLEIITTSQGERSEIWKREDGTLGIEPWRFTDQEVEVSVEVRLLQQLMFSDDKELGAALNDCQPFMRSWTFRTG